MKPLQVFFSAMAGACLATGLVFLFFREPLFLIFSFISGACVGPGVFRRRLERKRKEALRGQMREALYHLVVSLRAGRSLEGAWEAALEDMDPQDLFLVYPLWEETLREVRLGFPIEFSLSRMAEKTELGEVYSLARTIEICKRTEGDVARIMEQTIHRLTDRIEIQAELRVLLAKKQLEQKIMNVLPLLIIALLLILSPDYLAPLYRSVRGHLIMMAAASLCVLSFWISGRISRIEL